MNRVHFYCILLLYFIYACNFDKNFSKSLIIHPEIKTKKVTTVTVAWIGVPNYHKILPALALNFSKNC